MRSRTPFAVLFMTPYLVSGAYAQFTPGHIFVAVQHQEPCRVDFPEVIVEIDPDTGDMSVFADFDDGICSITGLRFTPDNRRLLALNAGPSSGGSGWIQAFNSDGTSEVILDWTDGLGRPFGVNGLAFDATGDLYVADPPFRTIWRFPGGIGPGVVFADAADGISTRLAGLDFAPNGDLFYGTDADNSILRINPDGVAFVFDPDAPRPASAMAIDRAGNIFIGHGGGFIFRYDNGAPNSLRVLASGFLPGALALAVSPDQSVVYFAEQEGKVYSVDAEDGTTTLLADMSDLPFAVSSLHPLGMAVYTPNVIPAVSPWGIVAMIVLLLFGGIVVLRRRTTPVCVGVCSA